MKMAYQHASLTRCPLEPAATILSSQLSWSSVELPALQLGLGGALSCLRHHPARQVSLRFAGTEPWSVDGDVYAPTAALELAATRPLRFLVP